LAAAGLDRTGQDDQAGTVPGERTEQPAALATGANAEALGTAGSEIEFTGVVTSIGGNAWEIGDSTVRVTTQTEIKAGVALGALVKVHASPQSDGSLLAREIELAAGDGSPQSGGADDGTPRPANEQEFTGIFSAINGDVWTIDGRQVRITPATEVKGSLQVGQVLKVHASPGADGVLVAREVELAAGADDDDDDDDDDDANPNEQEFTGVLSAINGEVWTVAGRQVRITSGTEVKGVLQVGDVIKVHASPGADGVLVAREVELAADDDDADDDNSGSGSGGDGSDDDDNSNSGPGGGGDDNSGSGSGGSDDDGDDDSSGSGSGSDDNDGDDNSGSGSGDDDDDDNSGSGSGDDDDDD
jgi:hypothetical protein